MGYIEYFNLFGKLLIVLSLRLLFVTPEPLELSLDTVRTSSDSVPSCIKLIL